MHPRAVGFLIILDRLTDLASQLEFFALCTADFVSFFVDVDMRQHQRRVDGERAEHLFCLGVVEVIEAAFERLAIERDNLAPQSPAEFPAAAYAQVEPRVCRKAICNIRRRSAPAKCTGLPYARAAFSSLS